MLSVWDSYNEKTEQRVKLLDAFMAFLVGVGALQFVYCVLAGNYVRLALPHEIKGELCEVGKLGKIC